jgi:hypothetical protein
MTVTPELSRVLEYHEADRDELADFLRAWHADFGEARQTVIDVRGALFFGSAPRLAVVLEGMPIGQRFVPDRRGHARLGLDLGHYLRSHANAIADGLRLERAGRGGRDWKRCWRVVRLYDPTES